MIHIEDLSSKHRPNFDKIVENSASNRAKQKECYKVSRDRAKTCKNPSFKNNY